MTETKTKVPAAAEPGSPDFDVDNASDEDYAKHAKILKRRSEVAGYTAPAAPVAGAAPVPAPTPVITAPDDVHAVHPEYGERTFSKITWDAMETQGEHEGWAVAKSKPADLPTK